MPHKPHQHRHQHQQHHHHHRHVAAAEIKQAPLTIAVKSITRSWEMIKNNIPYYRSEIATTFEESGTPKDLFTFQKFEEVLSDDVIHRRLYKHSCAVMNFMEYLVQFVNGNEETKPILFVLGKHHKLLNVNEKMFLEMKDAICKVIRAEQDPETARNWDYTFQYILINYVFQGMHMIEAS